MKPFYQQSIDEIEQSFATNRITGLSVAQAQERLKKMGSNELKETPPDSLFRIFLRQFQSPLIYILLLAAIIIIIVGDSLDALIISVILFFNAFIGTIQEGRTQRLIQSLKRYITQQALVIRNNKKEIIPTKNVVPGDIIILQQGERVPADARLVEAHMLIMDESMLTGEAMGIIKSTNLLQESAPISDQKNMIFKGTYVLAGNATALVVATGKQTELAKIGSMAQEIEPTIPLKKDLDLISHMVLIFIIISCVSLFFVGIWHGRSWNDLLIILSALFICVVPEGLPIVFTLALVNGAYRMAQEKVVVKKLHAAEGLGRISLLVIDKTGTLTKNEMMVSSVYTNRALYHVSGQGYNPKGSITLNKNPIVSIADHQTLNLMAQTASLLNRTKIELNQSTGLLALKGDPTQAALFIFSQKAGYDQTQLAREYTFVGEIPFQAEHRYQANFYLHDNQLIALITASPEYIMQRSIITEEDKKQVKDMLADGLRVIGAACKIFPGPTKEMREDQFASLIENDLTFLGFFGLQDTIRDDVELMIENLKKSGIKTVMATGDHQATALYVARAVSIFKEGNTALDGSEFAKMSDEQIGQMLNSVTVFSRLAPEHKLRLINLYHKEHEIVAMTGDGVNDAPSLVAADIGIAMGIVGTEIAKEVADIILLDDSFGSIARAIEYSRHIATTLRRIVLYFFATNLAELFLMVFAIMLNYWPLPLIAVQIFWLNLITDGFLNVALALEPHGAQEKEIFWKPFSLVDRSLIAKTLYMALIMALGSLLVFMFYLPKGIILAQTITLVTMAMFQWMNAWNCRSEILTNVQIGFFSNKWLLFATSFVFSLQVGLVYIPFMQRFFHTTSLSLIQWVLIICLTSSIVIIEELRKLIMQKGKIF